MNGGGISVRRALHVAAVTLGLGSCGGSVAGAPPADDGGGVGPKCIATPTLLIAAKTLRDSDAQVRAMSVVMDVAVSTTDLYAAVTYDRDGAIFRVPLRGGEPVLLTPIAGEEQSLLVVGDSVVYSESGQEDGGTSGGDVVRIGLQGGPRTVLASGSLGGLVSDGQSVYFTAKDGTRFVPLAGGAAKTLTAHTGALAVVGSNLVVADSTAGGLFSVPAAGGTTTRIASDASDLLGPVVACGSSICWASAVEVGPAEQGTGSLVQLAPSGTATTLSQGPGLYGMYRLAFDGTTFFGSFVGDAGAEGVVEVAGTGGTLIALGGASGIAVDDECLYTGDVFSGVYSVAKGSAAMGQ